MKSAMLTSAMLLLLISRPVHAEPARIIFDTDIGSDCDDAGAMAVLHQLANRGEIQILATIFSSRGDVGENRFGPGVIDAINTWYGRPDLPIGANKGHDVGDPGATRYLREIGADQTKYGHDVATTDDVPDMIDVYRKVLTGQPDGQVVIVTVGHPVALHRLLHSPPDRYSKLDGKSLIRQKVRRWIAMGGGNEAQPSSPWNLVRNGMADCIAELLREWPVDYFNSGGGSDIHTGRTLGTMPAENPVREAYRLWLNGRGDSRSSWDQLAVLFAARGERYFKIDSCGSTQVANHGKQVFWDAQTDNPRHHRVMIDTSKISKREIESLIENLMVQPPRPGP